MWNIYSENIVCMGTGSLQNKLFLLDFIWKRSVWKMLWNAPFLDFLWHFPLTAESEANVNVVTLLLACTRELEYVLLCLHRLRSGCWVFWLIPPLFSSSPGIIYDVIVEPPSVGSMTDEHGHQRPVAFLAYRWDTSFKIILTRSQFLAASNQILCLSRVNGQYIMEGLASSFLFTMGGLGFIILDRSNAPNIPKLNRFLLLFIGFVSVLLSFFMARMFMRMKLP